MAYGYLLWGRVRSTGEMSASPGRSNLTSPVPILPGLPSPTPPAPPGIGARFFKNLVQPLPLALGPDFEPES